MLKIGRVKLLSAPRFTKRRAFARARGLGLGRLLGILALLLSSAAARALPDAVFPIFKEAHLEKIPWAKDVYVKRPEAVSDVTALASAKLDGKWLLAIGTQNCVSVWDLETLEPLWTQSFEGICTVYGLAFANGKLYAASGVPGSLGKLLKVSRDGVEKIAETKDCFYALAASPDGKYLAAGSFDGVFLLYDAKAGKTLLKEERKGLRHTCFAFSSDSQKLLAGYADSNVDLFDSSDGFKSAKSRLSAGGVAMGVAFGPQDAGMIALASDDMQEGYSSESFAEGLRRKGSLKGRAPQAMVYEPKYMRLIIAFGDGRVLNRPMRAVNHLILDSLELERIPEGDLPSAMDYSAFQTWLWSVCLINENSFAVGGKEGRVFIYRRDFGSAPAGTILILSPDAKRWAAWVKEVYARASDPKLLSWKMYSEQPPVPEQEKVFREDDKIKIFMQSVLSLEEPSFKTAWPKQNAPVQEAEKADRPKKGKKANKDDGGPIGGGKQKKKEQKK